jgi:hypothetical protein
MKDKIVELTRQTLINFGIDPILFVTILGITISIYHIRNFIKYDWGEISTVYKIQAFATFFGTIILMIISLIKIISVRLR